MSWPEELLRAGDLTTWVSAFVIAFAVAFMLLFARQILVGRLATYAVTDKTPIGDVLAHIPGATRQTFLLVLALYTGTLVLDLPLYMEHLLDSIVIIAVLAQAALWADRGIVTGLSLYLNSKQRSDAVGASTVALLGFIARVAAWALAALMILDNLGFNVSALVASLGIGGIAVALAVQNILGDIFASLSITLDKPFVVGDFVVVEDILGTIEYVGVKTTRLRSLSGEQIIFSNAELLKRCIRNYGRMVERRVLFTFGVVYQTPYRKIERIPAIVRDIIERQPKARFDRAHFKAYGDSSLDFEIVYFVLNPDYNVYMDTQQSINLEIFRCFEQDNIAFAYPTRTLHVYDAGQSTN